MYLEDFLGGRHEGHFDQCSKFKKSRDAATTKNHRNQKAPRDQTKRELPGNLHRGQKKRELQQKEGQGQQNHAL